MYLGLLNEAQKELYAELAINLASADGTFSEEERLVVDAYCQEMGILVFWGYAFFSGLLNLPKTICLILASIFMGFISLFLAFCFDIE